MQELYRRVAAPTAALTIAIGVAATSKLAGAQVLGPATTQVCKHHEVSNGDIMQCRTTVNGVTRELKSQTTRDFSRYTPQGDLIRDHYTLYRDTKYNPLGRRSYHAAACRLVRYVNMEKVPVTCQVPASETNEKVPQPVY
jgi:hypothetical protein